MAKTLELILKQGNPVEFLFDLGQLKATIEYHGLKSIETNTHKMLIQSKYGITRENIRGNWILYQSYVQPCCRGCKK